MGKCVECQEDMVVIGTEKFVVEQDIKNFEIENCCYKIFTVWYCSKCNVLYLREPKTVYG